jgi:polyhydroxyalkanoate synthesis regulator phasin
MIFFSTCGTKSKIDKLEKRVNNLENTINYNDSINKEMSNIDREILLYETSREVVYNWNAIVRTTERPDDVMNKYNSKITELQKQKEKLKNVKK